MSDFINDELSEADEEFLSEWENMGKDSEDREVREEFPPLHDEREDIPESDEGVPDPRAQEADAPETPEQEAPESESESDDDEDLVGQVLEGDDSGDLTGSSDKSEEVESEQAEVEFVDEPGQTEEKIDVEAQGEGEGESQDAPEDDLTPDTEDQLSEGQGQPQDGGEGNSDDERMGEPENSDFEQAEDEAEEAPETPEEETEAPQSESEAESEPAPEEKPEGQGQPEQEKPEFDSDGMPEKPEHCEGHCEDNDPENDSEECPYCDERIKRERKQWGVVAKDMNGVDLLPGDKVRVEVPVSFMIRGSILAVNVPNEEFDRVVHSTSEEEFPELLWLSSNNKISQFTGYHLKDNGPVWTFKKGKTIKFVVKVGEPQGHDQHLDNAEEGGQLDIEDQIQDFLDKIPETEEKPEDEIEDDDDDKPESEKQTEQDKDEDDEEQQRRNPEALTKTQVKRFENITERVFKKAAATFGHTVEGETVGEFDADKVDDGSRHVARTMKIVSRGVEYNVIISASRDNTEGKKS